MNRCDECKSTELRKNQVEGTVICYNCGLVQRRDLHNDSNNGFKSTEQVLSNAKYDGI